MNNMTELLHTLASKSGGGAISETLEPQEIRGVAMFLTDGRVVLMDASSVTAEEVQADG